MFKSNQFLSKYHKCQQKYKHTRQYRYVINWINDRLVWCVCYDRYMYMDESIQPDYQHNVPVLFPAAVASNLSLLAEWLPSCQRSCPSPSCVVASDHSSPTPAYGQLSHASPKHKDIPCISITYTHLQLQLMDSCLMLRLLTRIYHVFL